MTSSLSILDLRADLARLPRQPGARPQNAPLLGPASLTFHFSDVVYRDRSAAAERRRVIAEAEFHLRKNWAKRPKPGEAPPPPVYGSRYQYHYLVFSNGQVAVLNDLVQLWHAGNRTANQSSIAVHVMLGRAQRLLPAQRESLYGLFDLLRAEHHIPRAAVYGHCEWPDEIGPAQPSAVYAPLPAQSRCPEALLHRDLVAYRARSDVPPAGEPWRALALAWVRPSADTEGQRVREIASGEVVTVRRIVIGELVTHASFGTSSEWLDLGDGYAWRNQFRKVA